MCDSFAMPIHNSQNSTEKGVLSPSLCAHACSRKAGYVITIWLDSDLVRDPDTSFNEIFAPIGDNKRLFTWQRGGRPPNPTPAPPPPPPFNLPTTTPEPRPFPPFLQNPSFLLPCPGAGPAAEAAHARVKKLDSVKKFPHKVLAGIKDSLCRHTCRNVLN